jgi:hypothetical protein
LNIIKNNIDNLDKDIFQEYNESLSKNKVLFIIISNNNKVISKEYIDKIFLYINSIKFISIYKGEKFEDICNYINIKRLEKNLKLNLILDLPNKYLIDLKEDMRSDSIFPLSMLKGEQMCFTNKYIKGNCKLCINAGLVCDYEEKILPVCGQPFLCLSSTKIEDFDKIYEELIKKKAYIDFKKVFKERKY